LTQNPNNPSNRKTTTGQEDRPSSRVEVFTVGTNVDQVRADIAAVLNAATTGPAFTAAMAALAPHLRRVAEQLASDLRRSLQP